MKEISFCHLRVFSDERGLLCSALPISAWDLDRAFFGANTFLNNSPYRSVSGDLLKMPE